MEVEDSADPLVELSVGVSWVIGYVRYAVKGHQCPQVPPITETGKQHQRIVTGRERTKRETLPTGWRQGYVGWDRVIA